MIGEPEDDGQSVERASDAANASGYDLDTPAPAAQPTWSPASLSDIQVIQAMGKDPQSLLSPTFRAEAAAYRDAVGKSQAIEARRQAEAAKSQAAAAKEAEKKSDPSYVAQQTYGRLGNIGASRVISKSTGPALFQHGEELNLGKAGRYYMAPSGYLMLPGKDGKPQRYDAEQVIQMAGVSVVPFLGGDEAAVEFRRTTGRVSSVLEMMDQLEDLYDKNGAILPLSDAKTRAAQIESQLPTIVSQIRSGSNSSAGVSDYETKAIEDSLPRRSNLLELDFQSRAKLTMVREQLRRIIMDRARRNGIEFKQIIEKSAPAGALPQASGNTPITIPGVTTNGSK